MLGEGSAAAGAVPGYFMYVVECADGTLYTGFAVDVEARIAAHNAGKGAKYTRPRLPVHVVAQASFPTKHQALSAEFHFKRLTRAQKAAAIRLGRQRPFEDVLAELFCDVWEKMDGKRLQSGE